MSTVQLRIYNVILTGSSSCLSILGGSLIFLTYAAIPKIRNFTRQLLLYLTIADLLTAIGNLVATARYATLHRQQLGNDVIENCTDMAMHDMETLCIAQSFVTTFSNMASFFCTFIIAFHLWSNVLLRERMSENKFVQLGFHLASWIIPLVLVSFALHKSYLGEDYCYGTGVWCGIKSNLPPDVIRTWMFLEDVGWQLTCYVLTCFLYMHVKLYILLRCRNQSFSSISSKLRDEDTNFVFVWMVIYLLKIWGIVRFFVTSYTSVDELASNTHLKGFLDFLLLMQSYGASGQAFWNSVIFCFCDRTVRIRMKSWLCRNSAEETALLKSRGGLNRSPYLTSYS